MTLTLFFFQNLEFDTKGNVEIVHDGTTVRNPLWSSGFCRKLSVIIAHPMWKGQKPYSLILFTIKLVIICRTNDRRLPPQEDVDLLRWASITLDLSANDRRFGTRHQEHQHNISERGGWLLPEAELLSAIWRMIDALGRVADTTPNPYLVSTTDLTTLTIALDSLGQGGVRGRTNATLTYLKEVIDFTDTLALCASLKPTSKLA